MPYRTPRYWSPRFWPHGYFTATPPVGGLGLIDPMGRRRLKGADGKRLTGMSGEHCCCAGSDCCNINTQVLSPNCPCLIHPANMRVTISGMSTPLGTYIYAVNPPYCDITSFQYCLNSREGCDFNQSFCMYLFTSPGSPDYPIDSFGYRLATPEHQDIYVPGIYQDGDCDLTEYPQPFAATLCDLYRDTPHTWRILLRTWVFGGRLGRPEIVWFDGTVTTDDCFETITFENGTGTGCGGSYPLLQTPRTSHPIFDNRGGTITVEFCDIPHTCDCPTDCTGAITPVYAVVSGTTSGLIDGSHTFDKDADPSCTYRLRTFGAPPHPFEGYISCPSAGTWFMHIDAFDVDGNVIDTVEAHAATDGTNHPTFTSYVVTLGGGTVSVHG